MSPNTNSSINVRKRNSNRTLCRICNFSGRKNNMLVTGVLYTKKVHISGRCSAPYILPDNSSSDDSAPRQCFPCKPSTTSTGTRVSIVFDSNRLTRHSTIQSGSRLSTPIVPTLAASASCVGQKSGSATSFSTATLNKSIKSKNGKCTDAFHLSLVQEFSQFKQKINDLQVTVVMQ